MMNHYIKSSEQQEDYFNDIAYQYRNQMHLGDFIQKPKVKMRSEYKAYYNRKKIPNKQKQGYSQEIYPSQDVVVKTQYRSSYIGQQPVNKIASRPADQLKLNLSSFSHLTSYKTQFAGHRGMNQYVRMKNQKLKNFTKTDFRATYSTAFKPLVPGSQDGRSDSTQKSTSFMRKTNWDNQIANSTNKSSYSMDFRRQKKQELPDKNNHISNTQKLTNPQAQIDIKLQKMKQKTYKPHDYSTKFVFALPAQKTQGKIKTVYQTSFQDKKMNSPGMNMMKFRKYKQRQMDELRNKMKTCYC